MTWLKGNEAKYLLNTECDGIEIYFAEKPAEEILDELREECWRWHKKKRCWYNYDSDEHREMAKKICDQYNGVDDNMNYFEIGTDVDCFSDYGDHEFDPSEWDEESLLRQNGYTVSQEEGLSQTERQRILSMVIRNHIMTPDEVIDHIERMVNLRDMQSKYDLACKKWREDMNFVIREFC